MLNRYHFSLLQRINGPSPILPPALPSHLSSLQSPHFLEQDDSNEDKDEDEL